MPFIGAKNVCKRPLAAMEWCCASLFCVCVCVLLASRRVGVAALNYYYRFAVYVGSISFIAIGCIPVFLIKPLDCINCYYIAKLLKHVTKLVGIEWELRNGHFLSERSGGVIVANHQSILDILGMFNIWDVMVRCTAVAKREVFWVWPFGLAAWLAGVIFINRGNAKQARKQLSDTSILLNKGKTKLWMFPEGTRNPDFTTLLQFKKGAFHMAISCQVPIYPVIYSPYYFINTKKKRFDKGHVIIKALPPIPTKGLTLEDLDRIMEETRSTMVKEYTELSEEVLASLPINCGVFNK